MLTGFTFCIPIKNKTAQEVVTAWRNHISFPFGVCRKLLMDNATEFKNELFSQVAEQLGVERKIYTPPYRPQSNGRIEGFHNFLKSCLAKHISRNREWDDVAPLSTTSYNWLPNQHSKESPFFVMFGRDTLTNLKHLISSKLRYMGMGELILDLEIMSNIYQAQIYNLKLARQCIIDDQKPVPDPKISTGDLVLVRDHMSKSFMPKYKTDYRVIRVLGNKVEVKDNNGKMSWFHISDVKKTDMITHSNQAREDDALFAGIPVYDGEDPSHFEGWLDAVKQACNMTDRKLRKELMKKSTGAIRETLSMMNPYWTDDDVISKLRQDFSSMSTMNRVREELKDLKQLPGQPISSYMYKYGRIHFLATGNQAQNERYPTAIMEFIESLNPKIMRALAKKHADPRTRPQMLQQAFNMAEEASRRILETESFKRSSTV